MDTINRLQQIQAQKGAPQGPKRIPIVITFVMKDHADAANAKEVREFCNERGLIFESRLYDSWRYRHDRDEIQRLPALHVAVNGSWERTFYLNTRPLQHIQEVRDEYVARLEERQRRKRRLRTWFQERLARVRRWFHRTTALEKAEADAAADAVRRASMTTSASDLADRFSGLTLADWE